MEMVTQSLGGLPSFLLYFALGVAAFAAFFVIYGAVTPYDELALIREGNVAAAVSLGGAVLGFMLPLASAIAHSVSPIDMVVWSVIALLVQAIVYFLVARLVPHFAEAIRAGRVAGATLLSVLSVATGILNAACMTY